jgi:hypothetical protein
VERDQHSGPEQGGEKGESEGVVPEPDAPEQPGKQTDVIMSRLPRTRPQRVTGRRRREPARSEATQAATARAAGTQATTGPAPRTQKRTARPKTSAATAAPAVQPKRGATAAAPAPSPSTSSARRRTAAPAAQTASRPEPTRRTPTTGGAASLPRLAADGAVEAAKLPLKVGGRLTLRALEAVARSLRNS